MAAGSASAIFVITGPRAVEVVEFYNAITGHYFMTADASEARSIDAGGSGAGWVRTGLVFHAFPRLDPGVGCDDCGVPVHRFYGPSPNTHVFTGDPGEAAFLRQPHTGWIQEGEAFRIPVPDGAGRCEPGTVPVVRLYNNRFLFNDTNHRYVWRDDERARMRGKGWIDEGARFCALGAAEAPLRTFALSGGVPRILPSRVCEDESVSLGPCVAVNNLPPPSQQMFAVQQAPTPFFERTGVESSFTFVQPGRAASAQEAAAGAYVQGHYELLGLHVETTGRGPAILSSINPLYQFRTSVDADGRDRRFFPWAVAYDTDVQLSISGTVNVKRLRMANADSHAIGHPTLEFIDQRSGKHLYFTALAYGTIDPNLDFLAPDASTGIMIVGTTLRASTPFGRNFGIAALHTPRDFVSESYWGWGGPFEFRVDRTEFKRIVDAARSMDAALSADIRDYLLDNFHFNNEIAGDGEIGLNLAGYKLQLLRR